MKAKTAVMSFVVAALLSVCLVPAKNAYDGKVTFDQSTWEKSRLFNFDFMRPMASLALYSAGLSMNPHQAIVGRDGWLFLGDEYAKVITARRNGENPEDVAIAEQLGKSRAAWDLWFRKKGVESVTFMLCPDKATIYAEHLPDWAKAPGSTSTGLLLSRINKDALVDARPALLKAAGNFPYPIYYRTDTHWNPVGAWVAFTELRNHFSERSGLQWPKADALDTYKPRSWMGGDLSNLLYLRGSLKDQEVPVHIRVPSGLDVIQVDFEKGTVIEKGGNPDIGAPLIPLHVISSKALNKKRVLWLRDSFGSALSPYMAATFTDTLQLHYDLATPALLSKLVDEFQPELVIVSVVERALRSEGFRALPPSFGSGTVK